MKYVSSLLQRFLTINDDPNHIAEQLTLKSGEIEEIKIRQIPDDVVIAKVLDVQPHPNADKLVVVQVDCGTKGQYQICTGGENVVKDSYVPVAIPGCYLPVIDLHIEKRQMRGEDSNGMICSKGELGINEDEEQHWIRTLQYGEQEGAQIADFDDITDEDIGKPLGDKYQRLHGRMMDVDNKSITHRPDMFGHFGVANELFAIYHGTDKLREGTIKQYREMFQNTNILEVLEEGHTSEITVRAETTGLRAYTLLEIADITQKRSDMLTRLAMLDMDDTPRNNRVDFSNVFMQLSGQPVHFFDKAKIAGGEIIIRNAKDGEIFTDLFDKQHTLQSSDIVIADKEKILALAGIVGAKDTGITHDTKDIVVEIANFDPVQVRKTGTRLGLRTDAELRYEKNINPVFTLHTLLFFLDMIKFYEKDLGSYKLGGTKHYINNETHDLLHNQQTVTVDYTQLQQQVFGSTDIVDEENIKQMLWKLGFDHQDTEITVPYRRSPQDVTIAADIHEEFARLYGYDNIPTTALHVPMQDNNYGDDVAMMRQIEDIMVRDLHVDQLETYGRVDDKLLDVFQAPKHNLYTLQNALAPELTHLRDSLVYNLLQHTAKNSKFFDTFRIGDIGHIRTKEEGIFPSIDGNHASAQINEQLHVGLMFYAKQTDNRKDEQLLAAKQAVHTIIDRLHITGDIQYKVTTDQAYHPKQQADIRLQEKKIGFVGTIHPLINQQLKIPEKATVCFVSLNIDILDTLSVSAQNTYETLQEQIVRRDLSFIVDHTQSFDTIIAPIRALEAIDDVQVFDLYQGKNITANKKSLSLSIKITGKDMTTEDINAVMEQAIQTGQQAGGIIRDQ